MAANVRRAKACMRCRQQKLKCDAVDRFPASCSRCAKQILICDFRDDFVRVSKRQRLESLENEISLLKQQINAPAASSSSVSPKGAKGPFSQTAAHSWEANDAIESNAIVPSVPVAATIAISKGSGNRETVSFTAQTLGNVTLTSEDITQLYEIFFNSYHPHFPFLTHLQSWNLTQLEEAQPLFWAIMFTAAQSNYRLHEVLHPHVRQLASDITLYGARSVHLVQALLVLSLWPLPARKQLDETAWLHIGVAIQIGYQIGLSRLEYIHEFTSQPQTPTMILEKRDTWIACFVVAYWLSVKLGVPSPLREDGLPPTFVRRLSPLWQYVRIASEGQRMLLTIANSSSSHSGLVDVRVRQDILHEFQKQLAALSVEDASNWALNAEIDFLMTRQSLNSIALDDEFEESVYTECAVQLKVDAIKIIYLMEQNPNFLSMPQYLHRGLAQSITFLIYLYPILGPDSLSLNSISSGMKLVEPSNLPQGLFLRTKLFLEKLWRLDIQSGKVNFKSRMAANYFYYIVSSTHLAGIAEGVPYSDNELALSWFDEFLLTQ